MENKLKKAVMADTTKFIKVMANNDGELINNINLGLKPCKKNYQKRYCEPILFEIGKIEGVVTKVKMNIQLIKRESKKKHPNQHLLELFISVHHILLVSIFDNLFKLINRILMTGTDDREVNFKLILSNLFIKGTNVELKIKQIQKCLSSIQFYRNQIVHENEFDYLFEYLPPKILNYFQMGNMKDIREVDEDFFDFIDKTIGFEVNQLCTNFTEELSSLEILIDELCDELSIMYENSSYRYMELQQLKET